MIASPQSPLSPDEYLQLEAQSVIKHEYIDGYAYAQAGATDAHNTIAGNLFALLRAHVRGTGCRVYISDMKARIESRNCYYYPDLLVTCDPRDGETDTFKRFPRLIIEVLSDSTEAFDRGDKFIDYQSLDTLQEYVLIASNQRRVDCLRRNEAGQWVFQYYTPEQGSFQLQSIEFAAEVDLLYEDVAID
jgi:Uma2 family endonuclease